MSVVPTTPSGTAADALAVPATPDAQGPSGAARAGVAMGLATLAMAAASGIQAVAYLSSFGVTARTDAFFAAFALYAVFGVFCQSIRVTSVPLLVGEDRAMRGRVYAATLAVIALPVLIACGPLAGELAKALAPGLDASARETTRDGLYILGGAMVLQLGAAGAATLLAVWRRFDIVAGAYTGGAVAGVGSYFAVQGAADELSLGWSMLSMAVVTAVWMFVGLQRARTTREPGRVPAAPQLARNAGVILARTLVYFVINGLFLVTLAFVSRADPGDATVLSYAYLFVSYLVAGTGVAVGVSRVPDMTRGAKSDWDEVVADTVPHGFRYAMMVSAPAVAALVTGGAGLVGELVPDGFTSGDVDTLRLFAALLVPWLIGALIVNYLLPALFALDRARLVNALALPVVVLHVAATIAGEALFGVDGVVAAFFVAPVVFACVLLVAGAGHRRGQAALELLSDGAVFLGLSVLAFSAGLGVASVLDEGFAHEIAGVVVGSVLYLIGLRFVAWHQVGVLLGAGRGGPAAAPADPAP